MSSKPEQSNNPEDDSKIIEKIKQIILANGIKDTVAEVIVKDAGLKGEGFASLTRYITIKFENSEKKPLNLFMKVQTPNAAHTQLLEELKAFEKEARFLVDYVAEANEMCKRKGREGFLDFYPKCYYGDNEMIVLENLVLDKGYELLDKEVCQDFEAAKYAIKTLAKHHAISHVMIQESGGAKKFFEKFPNLDHEAYDKPFMIAIMEPAFDNVINSDLKILEISGIKGASETAAKLKSFLGKPMGILTDTLLNVDEDTLLVLGHGDYWNNNMMFLKDNETKEIIHHMAIDFQITRYNSLAIDLGYYLFTSVQKNVRENHLKDLLELYRETLNSTSEDFGHPMNLSSEKLFTEFRKKFRYGFWISMYTAVGPGMSLFKEIDIGKVDFDLKDWVNIFNELVYKWIDENPDKSVQVANQIVNVLKEYDDLVLENV